MPHTATKTQMKVTTPDYFRAIIIEKNSLQNAKPGVIAKFLNILQRRAKNQNEHNLKHQHHTKLRSLKMNQLQIEVMTTKNRSITSQAAIESYMSRCMILTMIATQINRLHLFQVKQECLEPVYTTFCFIKFT